MRSVVLFLSGEHLDDARELSLDQGGVDDGDVAVSAVHREDLGDIIEIQILVPVMIGTETVTMRSSWAS